MRKNRKWMTGMLLILALTCFALRAGLHAVYASQSSIITANITETIEKNAGETTDETRREAVGETTGEIADETVRETIESKETESSEETLSKETETEFVPLDYYVQLTCVNDAPATPGYYHDASVQWQIMTNAAPEALLDAKWYITYKGTSQADSGEWVQAAVWQMDSDGIYSAFSVFDTEGDYEIYFVIADIYGRTIASEHERFMIERTPPKVVFYEISEPAYGQGIYHGGETLQFKIEASDEADDYQSGIARIVYTMNQASTVNPSEKLIWSSAEDVTGDWEGTLAIETDRLSEGFSTIYVVCYDLAGNQVQSKALTFCVDRTTPDIQLLFDTSDAVNGQYYRQSKQVQIVIREAHFTGQASPVISGAGNGEAIFKGWHQTREGYETILNFEKEGIYQVTFSCRDQAGNLSKTVVTPIFVIDQTAPVVMMNFEGESPDTKSDIYKQAESFSISVLEQNFNAASSEIKLMKDGKLYMENVAHWQQDGPGYRLVMPLEEGEYQLLFDCVDAAGNSAPSSLLNHFIIDRTQPDIRIMGVADQSANRGVVAPAVAIADTYLDTNAYEIILENMINGKVDMTTMRSSIQPMDSGVEIVFDDFSENMDGIYLLSVKAKDYAGNEAASQVFFSVNRHGSAFGLSASTRRFLTRLFVREPEDLTIYETNIDFVTMADLSYTRDGQIYQIGHKGYDTLAQGNANTWKRYIYTIHAENFQKEGMYTLHLYSEDAAGNRSVRDTDDTQIRFFVDHTPPEIQLSNIDEDAVYEEKQHVFGMHISDNIQIATCSYYINERLVATYDAEEIHNAGGCFEGVLTDVADWQNVRISATDAAGNVCEDRSLHVYVGSKAAAARAAKEVKVEEERSSEKYSDDAMFTEIDAPKETHRRTLIILPFAGISAILFLILMKYRKHMRKDT